MEILKEIGIINPNKLKAKKVNRDMLGRIIIERWEFYDGKIYDPSFSEYYARYIPPRDIRKCENKKFFKFLKPLKVDRWNTTSVYGIPKDQVQIVDDLKEIGVNNPNITPDKFDSLLYDLYYKIGDKEYSKMFDVLKQYGAGNGALGDWLQSLDQTTINKLYHYLRKTYKDKLQEIGVNKPKITPSTIQNLVVDILHIPNYSTNRDRSISGICYNHGWNAKSNIIVWMKMLDMGTLSKVYYDLLKLKQELENEQ